ncbi:MAG: adenine phosphoribosyltransferase [Alphaproteobacteria bacterium]
MNFKQHIRSIPDFPQKGILFYDISTLLANPVAWQKAIDELTKQILAWKPDKLLGIESRGFLLAAPLSLSTGVGFSMIRKPGKLPGDVIGYDYDLEYGSDRLEIQSDAVEPGQRVVILDDLLATGGTLAASVHLSKSVGAEVVGAACLIELDFLKGREKIDTQMFALMNYDS